MPGQSLQFGFVDRQRGFLRLVDHVELVRCCVMLAHLVCAISGGQSPIYVGGQCRRSVSAVSVGGQCRRSVSAVSVYATYATYATGGLCLRDPMFALSALSCSTLLLWTPAILSSRHRRRDLHFADRAASQGKKCPL